MTDTAHYLVLVEEHGEGCDYTIGCGKTWEYMDLPIDLDEAFEAANKWAYDTYEDGESSIFQVHVIIAGEVHDAEYTAYRKKREAAAEAGKQEDADAVERKEYERLKEKYGDA
jgi:hypothetical protein